MPEFDPLTLAVQYFCLLFALCVHEAAHALMADYRGDSTARFLGRITLDPRKHADILGTVVFPILAMATGSGFLFGWAKPVPFNPLNLKDRARDPVLIAIAGPASNVIMGCVSLLILLVLRLAYTGGIMDPSLFKVVAMLFLNFTAINFVLALFNVIPVPPLDGHYVLKYFLSPSAANMLERIGPFGIIIALLVAGPWLGVAMQPIYQLIKLALGPTFG